MLIGFAGLGIMGHAMVRNLMRTGFAVSVWNRTRSKAHALQTDGARVAPSLPRLAEMNDVVITMVNDTPDVQEVILGEDGLVHGLAPGKTVIDMSTISPDATEEIAAALHQVGCDMLDAPVSGGDVGAQKGTLTIMVGGDKAVFVKMLPVFQAMGQNITHCGGHGDGQRVKMINQVFCGLHAIALAEGFTLAEKLGLNLNVVHRVVASGAAGSWALDNYGPRLLRGDHEPGFKLSMQQKDLRIASETVEKLNVDLPGIRLAHDRFSAAKAKGLGDKGSHGIIELYAREE